MRSLFSRALIAGAAASAVIVGCVISQDDLAATACDADSDCPGGYRCAADSKKVSHCELIFPVKQTPVDGGSGDAGQALFYCNDTKPLIDTYCVNCHGLIAPGYGYRFDLYDDGNGNGVAPHAAGARDAIFFARMPKIDAGQLTADQRTTLLRWFDNGYPQGDPAACTSTGWDAGTDAGTGGQDAGTDAGTGVQDAGVPYSAVQGIFDSYCTVSCHKAGNLSGNLNLTTGNSYASLVGVNSSCNTAVKRVATTKNPIDSMLWRKTKPDASRCNAIMPQGTNGLESVDPAAFGILEQWLKEGAKP